MRIKLTTGILALAVLSVFPACNNSSGGFDTDPTSGIRYHFFNHNDKGNKPAMGDYAQVYLTLKNDKDSVIFDSRHKKHAEDTGLTVKLHLTETFKGCLADGVTMMATGDSASFKLNADSFYLKTFHSHQIPAFIQPGSMLTFNIKLVGFETSQQMADDIAAKMKENEKMMEQRKADEQSQIAKYIADNKITAKPESDGIYILERTKGKGKAIKNGDTVEVQYTGALLNGTIVETSNHGPERTTFTLVYGKDSFIKGFDDIIAKLEEGGSVKALIPSAMAYGEQSEGTLILPYTPLIYTVEVVNVK